MTRALVAASLLFLANASTAQADEFDPMSRPNTVAIGVGVPSLLSASYEQRLAPHGAVGARVGAGFVINGDAFGRIYMSPGRQTEPFFQANIGYSEYIGWGAYSSLTAGLDVGLRHVAKGGFTVSARVGGIIPVTGDLNEISMLAPNAAVQLGHSF